MEEIYEGDIVQMYDRGSISSGNWKKLALNGIGEIYFEQDTLRWRVDCKSWKPTFEAFGLNRMVEVIGNIYENPELLK